MKAFTRKIPVFIFVLIGAFMLFGASVSAEENTFGAFTVSGDDLTGVSYSGGVLTVNSNAPITIKNTNQTKDADGNIPTTGDRIFVADGVRADITLAGVNIERNDGNGSTAGTAAFMIADNSTGNVTITLADGSDNRLESGELCAGLQKNGAYISETQGKLTIKGDTFGTGKLTAIGGKNGAGIGGEYGNASNNIEINGGIVNATGGESGAGIGGGYSRAGSNIEINGGTVTATGGWYGAGIGGGDGGIGSNINISGGTVTATGGENGAGIGGGAYGAGNNIRISGGTVTATGGEDGAGIGGGFNSAGNNIRISGGSVKAVAGEYVKAIGGGSGKPAVTPTSDGTTKVYLTTLDIGAVSSASVKLNGEATATT